MQCPADASLVRRDPDVPGLAVLLDSGRTAELLARVYPEAALTAVEPRYVRYKRGTSCLVGYSVECATGAVEVYARAHTSGTVSKLDKAAQRESVSSPLGAGVTVIPEQSIVIYPFPNDHELPSLRELGDPRSRRQLIEHVLPDEDDLRDAPLEALRYKPERRYVAHLRRAGGGGAVLKFCTRQDYLLRKDNVDTFASSPALRVPRRLGRSRRYHVTAVEWLEGVLLPDAIHSETFAASFGAVGAAVAHLHAQKPKKLQTVWSSDRYAQILVEAADAVAEVLPDMAGRAGQLARRLAEKLTTRHWREGRAIHGDLAVDQVVLQDDRVGIIDFDRAGYGDPRIDLARLRAGLIQDVIRGMFAADRADACLEAFLDAYRTESRKDVTRKLERFTAAALLQHAIEPFRRRDPDWPARTVAMIEAAEQLAGAATEVAVD